MLVGLTIYFLFHSCDQNRFTTTFHDPRTSDIKVVCDSSDDEDEDGNTARDIIVNEQHISDIEVVCDSSDDEQEDGNAARDIIINEQHTSDIEVVCDSSDDEQEDGITNDYERKRAARIALNKRRLNEVLKAKSSFECIVTSEKRKRTYNKAILPPRQKSLRLASLTTKPSYDETKSEKQLLAEEAEYEKCEAYKSKTLTDDFQPYGAHPDLYLIIIKRPGRGRPDLYWKLFNSERTCYEFENCDTTGFYRKGTNQPFLRSYAAVDRFIERYQEGCIKTSG